MLGWSYTVVGFKDFHLFPILAAAQKLHTFSFHIVCNNLFSSAKLRTEENPHPVLAGLSVRPAVREPVLERLLLVVVAGRGKGSCTVTPDPLQQAIQVFGNLCTGTSHIMLCVVPGQM